jgi:hypothetical protein
MTSSGVLDLCKGVDGATMMRHLGQLARWVKLSGTAEEAESLRYLRSVLDGYGYNTSWLEHDAYISLPISAHVEMDGVELKAITHSMSRSSPPGGMTGRLVYLGEGTEEDFAGRDLRGCILLLEGIASPAAALRASRAGAAGQLHISPHEHLHEMCISPVWGSPAPETMDALPNTVAVTVSHADGSALRERLAQGVTARAAPRVVLHAEVDTGWRRTPILVAELDAPSAGPDTPFILFSGHHDTWYEGVMDNGAANVTMLEVARLCATRRVDWRRGLRLCFWSGHSHGRYSGSAWYADTHWEELERRCAVHVNVDSTGGVGASILDEAACSSELSSLAADAISVQAGQGHKGKRLGRAGDQSFWGIGVPAMFMSLSHQPPGPVKMRNPLGWWWHTPDDLLDKIDPNNLVRDTRVYVHAISRLLTDPVLPLNYAAHATALLAELQQLERVAVHGIELGRLLASAAALRAAAAALSVPTDPEAVRRQDAALMRAARALVPLDYTSGDRFAHDPALPQPAWPVLEPLRRLVAAEPGTDEAYLLAVAARRACNRVGHALGQARAALTLIQS